MATSVDSLSIQITASTKSAKDRVDELCKSLENLVSAINSLDTSKFEVLTNQANSLSEGLAGLKGSGVKQVEKMAEALHAVAGEKNAFNPIVEGEQKVAEEAKNATKSEEEIVDGLRKLDATPLEQVSSSIGKVSDSLNSTSGKLSWFKSMLAGLKIIIPTEGLENVNKKIDKLSAKVQDLKDKLAYKSQTNPDYVNSDEMEKDQKQIEGLINELERLKLKKQELESHGGFKLNIGTPFRDLAHQIRLANDKLGGFISKLHKTKSAAHSTAKGTREFTLSANKLAKELFRVSKMLKLMVTRMALRAVIKEVGNGFKSLALHSEEFNKTMSAMINASKKLGYSFSAMVAPLINALAPALIYLLNILTRLINAINQIFSALSGKSTYNKAKDFAVDWAKDIEDANKKAKELKKTVLGFDELNQMQEKYTSGGDTSGNIEDMFDTVAIETKWKKVADYIKNLAKRLFEPIKKAWQKVGDFVKKSWKYAMDEVLKLGKSVARDFWKVWEEEKTQKIFENILKIIGYIGVAVGNLAKRFREAWDKNNTGLKILRNIRDIVLIITEYILKMAKATADWADSLDFSPILEKFNEWLDSVKPVVNALMGIVSDFYETVILPLAKWAIEEGGPQLLQVFIDFNEKVDWDKLRERLQKLWVHLEKFGETVGEGLIIFINDCAQALANFINSQEFEDFLTAIENWMDSVTPQDVADGLKLICEALAGYAVLKGISTIISGIATALGTFGVALAALVGIEVGKWLMQFTDPEMAKQFEGLSGTFKLLYQLIKDIVDYIEILGESIRTLWDNIFSDDIKKSASDTLLSVARMYDLLMGMTEFLNPSAYYAMKSSIENLNSVLGIEAETMQDVAMALLYGIDKADELSEKTDGLSKETQNAEDKLGGLESGLGVTAGAAKDLQSGFKDLSDEATESAGKFDKATSNFGSGITKNSDKVKSSLNVVKTGLEDARKAAPVFDEDMKKLLDTFGKSGEKAEGLSSNLKNLSDNTTKATQKAKEATTGFNDTKTAMDKVTNAEPVMSQSMKNICGKFDDMKKSGEDFDKSDTVVWQNFEANTANASIGFEGTTHEIQASMDGCKKDLLDDVDEISKSFTQDKWTFSGVWEGLKKSFEKAEESIKSIWDRIANKLNGEHEIGGVKFRINLPKFYATGGFPEDGFFFANSSELVGRFDNGKTAVANNEQIIAGISQGVYSAVTAAMSRNSGNAGYIANTIVVDGEVIARTVTKAQQKQNMRYSPVMG